MIQCEMETRSISREEVIAGMEKNLVVMEQAVERGIRGVKSPTGLTGGDAVKVQAYMKSGKRLIRRYDFGRSKQSCCNK